MVHLGRIVIPGQAIYKIVPKVIGAGNGVRDSVWSWIKGGDSGCYRIDGRCRNTIARELAALQAAADGRSGCRVVDRHQDIARVDGLGKIAGPLQRGRHAERPNGAIAAPRSFIAEEEERPVLAVVEFGNQYRPAQGAAVDVVAQRRLLLLAVQHGGEAISGVEFV